MQTQDSRPFNSEFYAKMKTNAPLLCLENSSGTSPRSSAWRCLAIPSIRRLPRKRGDRNRDYKRVYVEIIQPIASDSA